MSAITKLLYQLHQNMRNASKGMLNVCKRKLPFKQSTVQGENVFELKLGKMLNEDFFPVNYDWLVLLE